MLLPNLILPIWFGMAAARHIFRQINLCAKLIEKSTFWTEVATSRGKFSEEISSLSGVDKGGNRGMFSK